MNGIINSLKLSIDANYVNVLLLLVVQSIYENFRVELELIATQFISLLDESLR